MKILHAFTVTAAALLVGTGGLAAQEVVKPPVVAGTALNGNVVKVISGTRVLVMKTADGKEVRLNVLPDARIMVNRKVVALNDLAVGAPVRVVYTDRAGAYQVSSIESPIVAVPTVVSEPAVVVPAQPAVIVAGGGVLGIVMEGDRPQPNLGVILRTQDGKVVATTRTEPNGTFAFRNVAPGTYVTYADKIASRTKGESLVTIKSGQILKDVVVNLIRPPIP